MLVRTFCGYRPGCAALMLAVASPAFAQHDHHGPATGSQTEAVPTPDEQAALYKDMAPLSEYLIKDEAQEIALARSAAPASISGEAEIMVMDSNGYHRAVAGKNGWTCLVERSWNDTYVKPDFWNPKIRVPICLNAAASQSVLPHYLERTKWVLAKRSLPAIVAESKLHKVPAPEPGSFAIMMSKQGYLQDGLGPAGPHVMIYLDVPASAWAAGLPASPVGLATPGYKGSDTVFYLGVSKWSDGTSR